MSTAGPLTTVFTPAPKCFTELYQFADSPGGTIVLASVSTSSCFPSLWTAYGRSIYSPAICPSGHIYTYCSSNSVAQQVEAGKTRAHCCPNGYSCPTSTAYGSDMMGAYVLDNCISIIASATALTFDSPVATGTAQPGRLARAYRVEVQWQASDVTNFQTLPPVTYLGGVKTSDVTNFQTLPLVTYLGGVKTSAASNSQTSSGLGTGAKIGIGVSVPLAVIAFLAGLFFFLRRRRRNMVREPEFDLPPQVELDGDKIHPKELDGPPVTEALSKVKSSHHDEKLEEEKPVMVEAPVPTHSDAAFEIDSKELSELTAQPLAQGHAPSHIPSVNNDSYSQDPVQETPPPHSSSPSVLPTPGNADAELPKTPLIPPPEVEVKDEAVSSPANSDRLEELERIKRRRKRLEQLEQMDTERRERLRLLEDLDREEQALKQK